MARGPVKVGGVDVSVGPELEPVFAQAGHRDVASDTACVVQQEGVGHCTWLFVQVRGGELLEQLECSGAGDLEAL